MFLLKLCVIRYVAVRIFFATAGTERAAKLTQFIIEMGKWDEYTSLIVHCIGASWVCRSAETLLPRELFLRSYNFTQVTHDRALTFNGFLKSIPCTCKASVTDRGTPELFLDL